MLAQFTRRAEYSVQTQIVFARTKSVSPNKRAANRLMPRKFHSNTCIRLTYINKIKGLRLICLDNLQFLGHPVNPFRLLVLNVLLVCLKETEF